MIICFNCTRKIKEILDDLIKIGDYEDYAEVISVAVENLNIMEQDLRNRGTLKPAENTANLRESSTNSLLFIGSLPSHRKATISKESTLTKKGHKRRREVKDSDIIENRKIPELFIKPTIERSPVRFFPICPKEMDDDKVTLDQWLFGQYNKLLPLKASCRAIANMLTINPEGIALDIARNEISNSALELGKYLRVLDKENGTERSEAVSTAFPKEGDESLKSMMRYASQFVGYLSSKEELSGLPHDYQMAGIVPGQDPLILLTEAGWEFALLPNPVLDGEVTSPAQKLSSEEREYLIDHVKRNVPVERFTFLVLLEKISNGAATPEILDNSLSDLYPDSSIGNFSKSFLSSQRSGAISRMVDLGLIARIRRGVRVAYHITKLGEKFLSDGQ